MTATTALLDGNVLAALTMPEHVHHARSHAWFDVHAAAPKATFATCPSVQGTLLRLLLREGVPSAAAVSHLTALVGHPRHEQWLDDISYLDVDLSAVLGHRQVTDAYLAQLARVRGGRLVTMDKGLAQAAPDVVELLPR